MKKAILIVAALLLVVSGVAAVSAYEAHIVNVKAKVELALKLEGVGLGPDYEHDFGTIFPEIWKTKGIQIGYSGSFCDQEDYWLIDYSVYAEPKDDIGIFWGGDTMYVKWMDEAGDPGNLFPVLGAVFPVVIPPYNGWVIIDPVGDPTQPDPGTIFGPLVSGTLDKRPLGPGELPLNSLDFVYVAIDGPDFEGYYNDATDPNPKPNGMNHPTLVIDDQDPRYKPLGVDLGVDLKIQITDIYASPPD